MSVLLSGASFCITLIFCTWLFALPFLPFLRGSSFRDDLIKKFSQYPSGIARVKFR